MAKKAQTMRKYYSLLLVLTTITAFTNCNNVKTKTIKEYYVISEQNGLKSRPSNITKDKCDDSAPSELSISLPPELKWYTDVVFIFDSNDKVHIYQTKMVKNSELENIIKRGDSFEPDYPYFLELQPEQLLTIKSNNFSDFIKDNNEIFKFDTLQHNYRRIFIAASTTDIIKNPAFYELVELIKAKNVMQRKVVLFNTRLTTDEENYVIKCKHQKIEFKPELQTWKGKYLDGKCKPYTKEFDLLEKRCCYVRKAINTFEPECTRLHRIL